MFVSLLHIWKPAWFSNVNPQVYSAAWKRRSSPHRKNSSSPKSSNQSCRLHLGLLYQTASRWVSICWTECRKSTANICHVRPFSNGSHLYTENMSYHVITCHMTSYRSITPGKWYDDAARQKESAFICGICGFVANYTTVIRNLRKYGATSASEEILM